IVDDLLRHSMVIRSQIEGIGIWLELLHASRQVVINVALVRVQVKLLVDDYAKQSLFDEDADSSEDGTIRDPTQKSQVLGNVTCQARFHPHSSNSLLR